MKPVEMEITRPGAGWNRKLCPRHHPADVSAGKPVIGAIN